MGQNVEGKSETPILGYADPRADVPDPFDEDANEIFVHSGPLAFASFFWWAAGTFLLLVLLSVAIDYFAMPRWRDGGPGLVLVVLGAFPVACFAAAFRRDDVVLDRISRTITIDRRRGFIRSRACLNFDEIERVHVYCDAARAF